MLNVVFNLLSIHVWNFSGEVVLVTFRIHVHLVLWYVLHSLYFLKRLEVLL